jgi:hypothetical protein
MYPNTGAETICFHYMAAQGHVCDGLVIPYNRVDVFSLVTNYVG